MVKSGSVKNGYKKNWEKRPEAWKRQGAAAAPFPYKNKTFASLIFAFLVLIRPTILSESLAQATPHYTRGTSPFGHLYLLPLFRRHNIWSWKNVHKIFVFVTSIKGTCPLFRGQLVPKVSPEKSFPCIWQGSLKKTKLIRNTNCCWTSN